MTESFLSGLRRSKPPPIPLKQRRRLFFIGGSLLGVLLSFLLLANTKSYQAALFSELESKFNGLELGFPTTGWSELSGMFNMSDLFAPQARSWLENRDFKVGREAKEAGMAKKHAVILIPGVISSGLESWGTDPDTASFFRKRVWGGGSMVRACCMRDLAHRTARLIYTCAHSGSSRCDEEAAVDQGIVA